MQYEFTIYGRPVPASRPRVNYNHTCYTKTYEAWRRYAKKIVTLAALELKPNFPKKTPLYLRLRFYFKPPRKIDALTWRNVSPDIDNLCKAVMDVMKGHFYADDAQIVWINCQKLYGDWRNKKTERIEVCINSQEEAL